MVYGGNEVLGLGRQDAAQVWPRENLPGGGCQVRVDTSSPVVMAGAIAGSSAAVFGCELVAASP